MPLEETTRNLIHDYCVRDLPGDMQWHIDQFSFIEDVELKSRLGRAYYSARYTYKLMEATFVQGDEQHPFVKFQIMQYASIYKPVNALSSLTNIKYGDEVIYTCVYRDAKTPRNSIPFKDKVDCSIRIGFLEEAYSEDIKRTYELRNLAHIETEASKQLDVEIQQSKTAYWRLNPFLENVAAFLGANNA
jgi:hypothetical protein